MEGSNQKISDDRGRTLDVNPRTGQKKARSLPRGENLVLSDVEIADRSLVSLDNSLNHPDLDDSAVDTSPDVTKRAHSFRRATRLHPIYSTDMSSVPLDTEEKTEAMDVDSDTDDPNLTRDHLQEYNDCGFTSRSDLDEESDNERLTSGTNCNEFQGDTNGCDISSSLPTLLDGNDCDHLKSRSEVIISTNRNSVNDDNECSKSVSDLMEVENEKKKTSIFRGRPHVTTTWIKSKKKPKASENKTITAFNDSFRKKSHESVNKDKNTKTAVQQLSNESDLLHAQKGSNARLTNWSSNDKLLTGSSTSLAPNMEDPWVKHSEVRTSRSSSVLLPSSSNNVPAVGRPRNKSDVTDRRALSRDNLDWMVYLNRNSLNEYPQNVKFLSKYCTPPRSTMTSIKPNKGVWRSESTKSDSVTIPHLTSPRLYPHSDSHTPTRGTNLSRSNSTPAGRSYLEFGRGFGRNRAASLDLDTFQESERIMEEMEDYMKHSPHPSLNHAKFPTAIPNNEDKDLNRLSGVSSLSTSSYDSQGSHSSSSDGLVGSLKNKISSWTAKMSKRNEEYEQMSVTSSVSDIRPSSLVLSDEEKYDNNLSVSPKSLSVSPSKDLPNFNYSQNTLKKPVKSNSKEPDLQSVLLEGGLGSSSVGSKLAHNLPPNIEAMLANKFQSPTRPHSACVLRDTDSLSSYDFSSKEGTPEPSARHSLPPDNKTTDAIMPATLKNTECQQSDSGFSMQSDVTDSCDLSRSRDEMSNSFEEKYKNEPQEKPEIKTPKPSIVPNKSLSQSPEVKNRTKDRNRTMSNSSMESMDSFYERRLSAALDAEVFRDSAVFCDIEVDSKLKSKENTPEPEHGVKTPRKSIRDYVQYLEEKNKPIPPKTFGVRRREPAAIIKQKLDHLKESSQYRKPNSRPASEERELSPPKCVRELQSTLVAETQGNQFRHRRGRAESEHSSESICSSNSSTLRSAKSLGRLDQLNNEVESLVIMKGWVQQLISKFQSDK
ncbi:uncharacterized protein LOC126822024 [Patella vulgata]|uniref:uncharacterized protein LOC126822024 n=1 Tax=Patella vulgata TaxID=6465 RepID=UPI00217FE354|nr:uncharacterized protein LOC126822024 [Patella vulgata]